MGNTFTLINKSGILQKICLNVEQIDTDVSKISENMMYYYDAKSLSTLNKSFTKHLFEKGSEDEN